ncbi:UDP-N-acetylmuramoyl-L-alanyl-D-glutamate--2,6-diaminopimelate ligase [Myxococcota bacterium]|nr:UDP-N-acetylmuramoyl-L-alanyl-D-glutamate--2,6-diaminopimelate ligase [Myxococcota bacterium]MBU1379518.1 UDP-N-acetylmuramoyl-L-alanyl-D-glutamate--2,6-diaminopimelate ligase [Myxococcota bacterium]MBU1498182.1 UDP-N-acetylmuramoyl-L-alanyl-D-glutamate--2,6-diaminopimelate ligase [Myxococcota bacterium]
MTITIQNLLNVAGVDTSMQFIGEIGCPVVSADSRKMVPGGLFIALVGISSDGHDFIETAAKNGAAAALVERVNENVSMPQFVVASTRAVWGPVLAQFYDNPQLKMDFVGITGTNGKTTTTYILEKILTDAGHLCGVIGTIEYRYGKTKIPSNFTSPDPEILYPVLDEMARGGTDTIIMEVSSHSLAQMRVGGLRFKAALLTNFTQDHLDFHKTMNEYASAKGLLFRNHLTENAFVCAWDESDYLDTIIPENSDAVLFGSTKSAHAVISDTSSTISGVRATVTWKNEQVTFESMLIGDHNILNITGALLIASSFDVEMSKAASSVNDVVVPGRLARIPGKVPVFVDYAHTPDALDRSQKALRHLVVGRLITVFGCGGDRDAGKRPKMGASVLNGSDIGVVTSDNPRTEDPLKIIDMILEGMKNEIRFPPENTMPHSGFTVIPDRAEAIKWAVGRACYDDCILIAGKGHEDYQIIGKTKIHFDDSEHAASALKDK